MNLDSTKQCSAKESAFYGENTESQLRRILLSFWELTKPRLSFMSVASAIFGYFYAVPEQNITAFVSLVLGTSLCAGGAAALNQWMERAEDALMTRTATRPIPAGIISPFVALMYGLLLSIVGSYILWTGTNAFAGILVILTVLSYVALYTPLKKVTPFATEIGALPGALPPLIGWVAATNSFSFEGWVLFGILFAWQIPHFMAICWNYKDEYKKGGFIMLSHLPNASFLVARKSLIYTFILIALTIAPVYYYEPSFIYWAVVGSLNTYFLWCAIGFMSSNNKDQKAKKLFFASIIYLPLLLIITVFDRCYFQF